VTILENAIFANIKLFVYFELLLDILMDT